MTNVNKFQSVFVLLLVLTASWIFLIVIWPFMQALLIGAILAGLCQPIYKLLVKLFRGKESLAAFATVIVLVLMILGPISTAGGLVAKQAVEVSEHAIPWVQSTFGAKKIDMHAWLTAKAPWASNYIPAKEVILSHVGEVAKAAGAFLLSSAKGITTSTAGLLISAFVMLYSTFYFLRDGEKVLEKVFYYTPLSPEHAKLMLNRFSSVTRATVKGTLLIGVIQGFLTGVAMYCVGIHSAAFWGAAVMLLSIIPGGGVLIWIPAVIYVFSTGNHIGGLLLAAWCVGVVSTIDNFLRPLWVGKDAQMPNLLILLGTLGGIFLFGPFGFIIGPVICGLFLTAWEIYGVVFKHALPDTKLFPKPK